MNKKYIFSAIALSVVISVVLGLLMPRELIYQQKDIDIDIELRADSDTSIKVYYLEQEGEDYTESKCVTQQLQAGDEFQQLHFHLPSKAIVALRIDCDTTVNYLDIKRLIVDTDEEPILLETDEIDSGSKNDILSSEVTDECLVLKIGDTDPFICIEGPYAAVVHREINYRYIVMAVSFCLLLFVFLCNQKMFIDMARGVFLARKQIQSLAISDFKSRFSGSYLGVFWAVAQPIMTIILFWFVFQVGFRSQPISNAPFVLWLVAGMIPWNFFSDAWLNGNNAFTGYSYIVKKLVFNIDILPLVKILSSFIMNIIFNLIIIIVYALYGRMPVLHLIDMLYFSICLTCLSLGLAMITATLNVFMKDVGQFLNIIMQFMMWLTPIMWDYHMIPERWSWAYQLNPLFYVTNGYREALIDGHWFSHHYYLMLWFWIVTITVNIIGMQLMKKLKPHFADVL